MPSLLVLPLGKSVKKGPEKKFIVVQSHLLKVVLIASGLALAQLAYDNFN